MPSSQDEWSSFKPLQSSINSSDRLKITISVQEKTPEPQPELPRIEQWPPGMSVFSVKTPPVRSVEPGVLQKNSSPGSSQPMSLPIRPRPGTGAVMLSCRNELCLESFETESQRIWHERMHHRDNSTELEHCAPPQFSSNVNPEVVIAHVRSSLSRYVFVLILIPPSPLFISADISCATSETITIKKKRAHIRREKLTVVRR